jgi:hypothetical protein
MPGKIFRKNSGAIAREKILDKNFRLVNPGCKKINIIINKIWQLFKHSPCRTVAHINHFCKIGQLRSVEIIQVMSAYFRTGHSEKRLNLPD